MKTMKLKVHGNDIMIDYVNENVIYPKSTSDEMVVVVSNYLMAEGFLDESFVEEMKGEII